MLPNFSFETELGICAGVDEAGRGALASAVFAAAVVLPYEFAMSDELVGLNDSKKLTADKREKFYFLLMERADCAIGTASVAEIERINILQATFLAMQRAIKSLQTSPIHVLVDGNMAPKLAIPTTCLVKGDSRSLSIAAASVIAKYSRDKMMLELNQKFPQYGWHTNKGYGTESHRKAIAEHGLSPHHRPSFCRNIKTLNQA